MPKWLLALNVLVPLAIASFVVSVVVPKGGFVAHDWWVTVRVRAQVVDAGTGASLEGVLALTLAQREPAGWVDARVRFAREVGQSPAPEVAVGQTDAAGALAVERTTVYGEGTEGDDRPKGPPPHYGVEALVLDRPGYGRVVLLARHATWTPDEPGDDDGVLDFGRVGLERE